MVAAHRTNGGANTTVMFDYGHFVCNYDAVVDDLGLFDAMIEVRSNTKRVRIIYDTPYIRRLPTRLEITEAAPAGPVNRTLGPDLCRRLLKRADDLPPPHHRGHEAPDRPRRLASRLGIDGRCDRADAARDGALKL